MSAERNLKLFVPYLVCSLEGVLHGVYLVWLTQHKGLTPFAVSAMIAASEVALLALEVPTGVFADRVGARASLICGSACQAIGLLLLWAADSAPGLALSLLAIAVGDAFRHGADEAMLYRSCAALGREGGFGRRLARAHTLALAALVALTAGGGWLVERAGFGVGFAVDLSLSLLGLALACAMTDPVAAAAPPDEPDAAPRGPLGALAAGLPWARIAPAAIVLTLAGVGQFLAQSESRGRISVAGLGLLIAAAQLLEAIGAGLVARGLVPVTDRVLERFALASIFGVALAALVPAALLPALLLVFLASGIAPAIRSALLQRDARDDARATLASAAGAVDLLGTSAGLPLCALAWQGWGLTGTGGLLAGAGLLGLALAVRSGRRRKIVRPPAPSRPKGA